MTTESKGETGGMDPGDDEALWTLLGRQEPPAKVSPYFARRVLRETAGEPRVGWWRRVRPVWTFTPRHTAAWSGAFALGALCLSAVFTIPTNPPARTHQARETYAVEFTMPDSMAPAVPTETSAPAEETSPAQDVELITDLDNLLSREESRLWTEDETARF